MIKILNNLIIEYNQNITYIDDIVSYINDNEQSILDFFKIPCLKEKYKVVFLDFDNFKEYIEKKYGSYQDSIIADADNQTKTIRLLSIEDTIKYTKYKNYTIYDTLKCIMHEFTHACHNEVLNANKMFIYIKEGLATNLANQEYKIIDLDCDFHELKTNFRSVKNGYAYSYTIVNYMLNHYSSDEVYKLISDVSYLKENQNRIFEEARQALRSNLNANHR